jgi:hypothetical protein
METLLSFWATEWKPDAGSLMGQNALRSSRASGSAEIGSQTSVRPLGRAHLGVVGRRPSRDRAVDHNLACAIADDANQRRSYRVRGKIHDRLSPAKSDPQELTGFAAVVTADGPSHPLQAQVSKKFPAEAGKGVRT